MKRTLTFVVDAACVVAGVLIVRDMWVGQLDTPGKLWLSVAAFTGVARMIIDDLIEHVRA